VALAEVLLPNAFLVAFPAAFLIIAVTLFVLFVAASLCEILFLNASALVLLVIAVTFVVTAEDREKLSIKINKKKQE
jgi:membrane protein implicated in regulation of membrane protease activity